MKPVSVEWSRLGFQDLMACARAWRDRHPTAPSAFDDDVEAAVAFLRLNPEGAPPTLTRRYKHARTKVLLQTGHLLVYRYSKSTRTILVLGVFAAKALPQRP